MNPIDYKEIRKRVEKRVKRRIDYIKQLIAYITVNLVVWLIFFLFQGHGGIGFPWPVILTVLWGIGIVIEGANLYFDGAMDRMREAELEREIEREHMRRGIYNEKPKRDSRRNLRLTDDGELIDDEGDEDDERGIDDTEIVGRQRNRK